MTDTRTKRSTSLAQPDLALPPGFHAKGLRELKDAFAEAQRLAASEGGGLVTYVHRFDTVEFALVIEPDEPLAQARRSVYAAMNALADAIATHCPPERPLTFDWPDTIRLDGGIIGGVRLGVPDGTSEDEVPAWLTLGMMVRLFVPLFAGQGHELDQPFTAGTSLATEGFEMLDGGTLIESFCRHLLVYVDQWQEQGFAPVGRHYLARLKTATGADRLARRGIAENGDLVSEAGTRGNAPPPRSLADALRAPAWRDETSGDPLL